MNQYTWDAAPRGKGMIKIVTYGKDHDTAQERAKEIVRDVWKHIFEVKPDHEIVGVLVKVEQGTMDVIHYEPHFEGEMPVAKGVAEDIARIAKDVMEEHRNVR